jgi:integrase
MEKHMNTMDNMRKGSIIERPRKDGTITYQAMVKIPGAKAAVRSFSDPEQARAFIQEVQKSRAKVATEWKERWLKPVSPGEQADRNQELWANEWLKTTLKLYNESDRITNRFKTSMRTIFKFGGDVKLGELDRKWVRDYIKFARKQMTRTKTPYKWGSIADHLKVISAAMNWRAEELDAKGAKLPFSLKMFPSDWEVKRERRLSADEERRLVAAFRRRRPAKNNAPTGKHLLRLFRLAIHTAARQQELVLAKWSEFDLDRKYWIIPAEHTKCKKARLVPLNKAALRVLKVMRLGRVVSC